MKKAPKLRNCKTALLAVALTFTGTSSKCFAETPASVMVPSASSPSTAAFKIDETVLFKAFDDELKRTVSKLKLGDHPSPYFASFSVSRSHYVNVFGAFGALDRFDESDGRNVEVDLRVGDYKFDNSGSRGFYSDFFEFAHWRSFAMDDDYDAIRRALWLTCDGRYKRAIEDLEKKKAVLRQKKLVDQPDSFQKVEPVVAILDVEKQTVDCKYWRNAIREISNVFRANPGIVDCKAVYENRDSVRYFQNSEGSKNREQELGSTLYLSATAEAPDGMKVGDFNQIAVKYDRDIPPLEDLKALAKKLSDSAVALSKAPMIEEYNGPVLFEGQAGAEFFAQSLAPHFIATPESSAERRSGKADVDLLNKKILPKFISVIDDPGATTYRGKTLSGGQVIDDEGVRAKRITLVDHGVLKTLCSSRTPVRGVKESNGHYRDGKTRISQLFVQSDAAKTPEDLRKQLIQLGKDANLSHVMIARKIGSAIGNSGTEGTIIEIDFDGFGGSKREIVLGNPTLLYRVSVADGSEELVRGARFSGLTRRTWRDIDSVGTDEAAYASVGMFSGGSVSNIIAPSILVSEIDIARNSRETDVPIVLARPDLVKPAIQNVDDNRNKAGKAKIHRKRRK